MEQWMTIRGDGGVKSKVLIEDMMVEVNVITKLLQPPSLLTMITV